MSLLFKAPYTSQPQGAVEIDWANPLRSKLVFAWDAAAKARELVTGRIAADKTTLSATGQGLSAQNSLGQKNIEWANQFITTSNGLGTGDFTMMVVANPASAGAGASEHVFSQKNDASGSPYAQAVLLAHSGARGAYTSGAFSFYTYRSADSEVSATGVCDGLEHVWIGVRSAGILYLYKDGALIASGGGFSGSLGISQASRYTAIGSAANSTAGGYRNQTSMARAWDRALSFAEVQDQSSIARYKLYKPQSRTLWLSGTVAAGGTTSVTRDTSASYSIKVSVVHDIVAGYSTQSSVNADTTVSYLLRTSVVSETSSAYDIRAPITSSTSASYTLLTTGAVTSAIATSYSIRAAVQSDASVVYALRGVVQNALIAGYDIRRAVLKDVSTNYGLLDAVQSDAFIAYELRGIVQNALSAGYDIRTSVLNDMSATYTLRGVVASDLTSSYSVLGAVSAYLMTGYLINGTVFTGLSTADIAAIWAYGSRTLTSDLSPSAPDIAAAVWAYTQ